MMRADWHDGYGYGRDRYNALLARAERWRRERPVRPAARERLAAALIALGQRLAPPSRAEASPPRLCGACGAPMLGWREGIRR